MLAVLAGGVGAARFLAGLIEVVDPRAVVAIVNTADDEVFHGLHVSPDLDSVTYTLAGANNRELGWGLAEETFRTIEALERYNVDTWFKLGDTDLATHLYRTQRLASGATLAEVTNEIAAAWKLQVRLIPMTNDPVRTRITVRDGDDAASRLLAMQEWFVRERAAPAVVAVEFEGASSARPAAGVLEALDVADTIVICPSNPVISIGPILTVPGIREALIARRDHVVAVSPIVGGSPVKGPADRLMKPLGIEVSCVGVARAYADFCSALVIDQVDTHLAPAVESAGVRAIVTDTMMLSPEIAAALARTTLRAVA